MDIHLVDVHLSLSGCGKQGPDTSESDYWGERLVVVDPLGLRVPLCH